MGNEIFNWLGLALTLLFGLGGWALGYGLFRGRMEEQVGRALHELSRLKEGGEAGTTVYMPRTECVIFREQCVDARCMEISKMQHILAEHSIDIRALHNFAFWFLSNKEGLPLTEVNRILELRPDGDKHK